jgi:parallel beta-helix repeat protein
MCTLCGAQDTWVVALDGTGDFTGIQPAIDAALDGDTVLVQEGEYVITEPLTFDGKAITVRGEADAGETIIRMSEEPADANRASVVIFENHESPESVLDGLTLTGGKGSRSEGYLRGGGVFCGEGSAPTLTNCTISENSISGNSASNGGSGVYCLDSSPTLTNCTISGNSAGNGGGVYCRDDSSPTLTNCTISGNSAFSRGAGVFCGENSSPTLTSCSISSNSGEGVYCYYSGSSSRFTDCTIANNS